MTDILTDTDSTEQPAAAGEWLDTRAAYTRLGISERTLYRRIASRRYLKRDKGNGTIEVWIPADEPQVGPDSVIDTDGQAQAERSLALVERVNLAVSHQVGPLLELVRDQQERLGELERENGRLQAELAAVTADRHDPKPWWRRWLAP
jgi:hypothetical protein